jgi:superfamily II DNA or RNA helicase
MTKYDKDEISSLMEQNFAYPDETDENFQSKIYTKREFYNYKIKKNQIENLSEDDIQNYRSNKCSGSIKLQEHQNMLSNFINPNTPYKGLLLFHEVGTGKTCAAISIAEKFKKQVSRYNTKIYILLSGPLIKDQWKREIVRCTDKTYLQQQNSIESISQVALISQYYKLMSYKTFYKQVLGEKLYSEDKTFTRDTGSSRITNMNNSLIIVEEAHNLTGNEYGEALQYIIDNSVNLRVLLLTATPMKNLGDDIVDLLNFIRPKDNKIKRDEIFTTEHNYEMKMKPDGLQYLKNMARGYVSYLRGGNKLTYATRKTMGLILPKLKFTKVVPCFMKPFQHETYSKLVSHENSDFLDKKSTAASNFIFPALDENKNLTGMFGIEGKLKIMNQLQANRNVNDKICDYLKIDKSKITIVDTSINNTELIGDMFNIKYLENFSTKFYACLRNINELFEGKKGLRKCFVYSNLVKIGIELFKQVLLHNGYLEYAENGLYDLASTTLCYRCGITFEEHKNIQPQTHKFEPATFLFITGGNSDEQQLSDNKQHLIDNIFNSVENIDGRFIKLILGSKVMNEGINLKNVGEVHILDAYYNLGRMEQVIGRAIRNCSHFTMMMRDVMYPEVLVYKYCVVDENRPSNEELLYEKAEIKYILIKQIERALKEIAIDCPLNYNVNVLPNEIEENKNCVSIANITNNTDKKTICPEKCNFTNCLYKCSDELLNSKYYDPSRFLFKELQKSEIDYSTFDMALATDEIDNVKKIIKQMFRIKHVYTLDEILEKVNSSYKQDAKLLFDDFFIFKALDMLIPADINELNNFNDYVIDKYDMMGYLIVKKDNYIFQNIDQPKGESFYYRVSDNNSMVSVELSAYIKQHYNMTLNDTTVQLEKNIYDEHYNNSKNENEYIGIIEYLKGIENFKIREKRVVVKKKREIGLPTLTGSTCTTKSRDFIDAMAKQLKIKIADDDNRNSLCEKIKEHLLFLEKTTKRNKLFVMIPTNQLVYPIPYNIYDRMNYIKEIVANVSKTINCYEKQVNTYEYKIFITKFNETQESELMTNLARYNVFSENKHTLAIIID